CRRRVDFTKEVVGGRRFEVMFNPGESLENGREVADAVRHDPYMIQTRRQREHAIDAHSSVGRLDAAYATKTRWPDQRPTRLSPQCREAHPARHRGCGARAAAAGG